MKPNTNKKSSKRNKRFLRGGAVHENIEINYEHFGETLHDNNSLLS